MKWDEIQPRYLKYRSHYKIYVLGFYLATFLLMSFWGYRLTQVSFKALWAFQSYELMLSGVFYLVAGGFYFFWLRYRMNRSVQVFPTHLVLHNHNSKIEIQFSEIESVNTVCWSIFYLKMKGNYKYYFNSSLERVDYIWDGIKAARPELIAQDTFEDFRLSLVQYDHHQKRKEWFFRHKLVDVFNWFVLPVTFLTWGYLIQSEKIMIHQEGLYFFRLFMYALLVLLITAFMFSLILKKFIFDNKIEKQMSGATDKIRDLEFEGVILQRSKIFQMLTTCFVLAMVIKLDLNLFSVSKAKEDLAGLNLRKGHTVVVDNRYNCVTCKYEVKDGDVVMFGRGYVGQVLAREGDMVGEVSQDTKGRTIASENVQVVPRGHLAIRASNGKDIIFVKIEELIGKIQN